MIYAIEAIGLDRVKIGRAKNPRSRFDTLKTGSPVPLRLIISEPWDDSHEALIHKAFSEYRIFGEWFHAGPRLVKFLHAMGQPGDTTEEKYKNAMNMLLSKCPKCGKEHYSTQRCSADKRVASVSGGNTDGIAAVRGSPVNKCREQAGKSPTQLSEGSDGAASAGPKQSEASGMLQGPPLTPAEKQKAYRERKGNAYRKANKLRMRRNRND